MAQSEVILKSNGATLMDLSEGVGRAPRVEGEPSSEEWKQIEGCHILERGVEANQRMLDPRARRQFFHVSSHP
jgi:hypothetical protein